MQAGGHLDHRSVLEPLLRQAGFCRHRTKFLALADEKVVVYEVVLRFGVSLFHVQRSTLCLSG
jgi:hypothetical protein